MTLDGKVATRTGDSKWISGEDSRRLSHHWRAEVDAVAVGIGTALADDAQFLEDDLARRRLRPYRAEARRRQGEAEGKPDPGGGTALTRAGHGSSTRSGAARAPCRVFCGQASRIN